MLAIYHKFNYKLEKNMCPVDSVVEDTWLLTFFSATQLECMGICIVNTLNNLQLVSSGNSATKIMINIPRRGKNVGEYYSRYHIYSIEPCKLISVKICLRVSENQKRHKQLLKHECNQAFSFIRIFLHSVRKYKIFTTISHVDEW